ncbi:tyrosine--tRNA ligase [Gammaproteobacteria bacterium]|nr:tyrosine--tRNA ligase [Gammaproteobacteria bacterium]
MHRKMSKSLNNYIGVDDVPDEMFGKIMSISDELMWRWFELLSFMPEKDIAALKKEMEAGKNPRDIKFILAEELVDRFHADGDGKICREAFLQRFQKGLMPEDILSLSMDIDGDSIPLTNLLKNAEMAASTSEAMRLIKQGGVKIDSEKVEDVKLEILKGSEAIYQVGKRKFLKIKV